MNKLLNLVAAMTLSSALYSPLASEANDSPLYIYMLDIGQGDAMLLHQPGISSVLIDAGPLLHGHRISRKLEALGIDELDAVIVTHPHLDHFGGLFDLYSRITIKRHYDNGRSNPVREYFSDYEKVREMHNPSVLSAGDLVRVGNLDIEILHPPKEKKEAWDLNGSSLVLRIRYHAFRLLHLGDLAGPAEHYFLNAHDDLRGEIIKIAHHGAEDATSEELLQRVQPRLALISTAQDNWINAPSPIVLDRLDAFGIKYLRTDRDGTIKLVVAKDGTFKVAQH